jgi:hypothetical protein
MAGEKIQYVRGVAEIGHIDLVDDGEGTMVPTDVPWGKTTEDGFAFTPGATQREYLYTGQDLGPVDSQVTRVEGTQARFKMAQCDPLTIARVLGLPEDAVTGVGDAATLKVKQKDLGMREFEMYAVVLGNTGPRRIKMPRAVVSGSDELTFTKGQWAHPGCTMTLLQPDDPDADFWEFGPEPEV